MSDVKAKQLEALHYKNRWTPEDHRLYAKLTRETAPPISKAKQQKPKSHADVMAPVLDKIRARFGK